MADRQAISVLPATMGVCCQDERSFINRRQRGNHPDVTRCIARLFYVLAPAPEFAPIFTSNLPSPLWLALPPKRITVNLAPADVAKEGSHFDLPIALGLLTAMGVLPEDALAGYAALGELALNGALKLPFAPAVNPIVCARRTF
jgi:hypothetical protein